jgi:hypothetical protein
MPEKNKETSRTQEGEKEANHPEPQARNPGRN